MIHALPHAVADHIPDAASLPVVGSLMADDPQPSAVADTPLTENAARLLTRIEAVAA